MKSSKTRAKDSTKLWLILTVLVILLGVPMGWMQPAGASRQPQLRAALNQSRTESLEKLYSQLIAGEFFSKEEENILRRFREGGEVTELEADLVISRALYDYYIIGKELTKQQEDLLARYEEAVARRDHDVADRKIQLLKKREAAAAAPPQRTAPLVAPANDLCSGAEVIPAAGPFPHLTSTTADITDATTTGDPPLPSCQASVSRSIWYTFTPATTAEYTISSCSSAPTGTTVDDTVMAIYTSGGCGGPFTELPASGTTDGCDDDSCASEAFQAVITTRLNSGTTYFIVVWQFGTAPPTGGNTAVQLSVTSAAAAANDVCAGAERLTLDSPVNGTTVAAGADYSLVGSSCFTGIGNTSATAVGREVVYTFTAPLAGDYSFRVNNFDATGNLVLYVSNSCPLPGVLTCSSPGGPVIAAANRDASTASEEVKCLSLGTAQQVYVFVDENSVSAGSSFTIEVNRCAQEAELNDTPGTSTPIVFGLEGSINPTNDADFYALGTPPLNSRIFAMVDGGAANDTRDFDLRVTSTTDTLEFDDTNNDGPFGSLSANIAGTPVSGAAAFLRVSHNTGTASEPYRLYAVVQPPIGTATTESEANDTIGTANSAANNYFTGALSGPAPSPDVDIFSFTAAAGDLVFVSLDCDPLRDNTPINAALALRDSSGTALVEVNDPSLTSSTTPSPGTLIGVTPNSPGEALVFRISTSGTYYAEVSIGTSSSGATGAGDYLLSISRNGLPGSCTYSISPASRSFAGNGGMGTITVTADPGCAWTAVSNDPSFITVTGGANGTGNGLVDFTVAANPGATIRAGTITAAGRTFVVYQGRDFADVPQGHIFYNDIGKLAARGVTAGCGSDTYCPDDLVTREQMAAFIIRALDNFNPPVPPSQRFADVPPSNPFYAFIEQMAVRQITVGCGGGNYCPSHAVLREQMAAFIIKGIGELNPPLPAMQRFDDVPPSSPFYAFIDRMSVLGITAGCSVSPPMYCPFANVTRGQMAVFLVRAFNL